MQHLKREKFWAQRRSNLARAGKSHSKSHGKSMSIKLLCCVATFCTKKLTCFKLLKGLLSRPGLVFCSKFCQFLFQWSCGHSLESRWKSVLFPIIFKYLAPTLAVLQLLDPAQQLYQTCARNVRDYTSRPLEPMRGSCFKKGEWAELETQLSANPPGYLAHRGKCHVQKCCALFWYIIL